MKTATQYTTQQYKELIKQCGTFPVARHMAKNNVPLWMALHIVKKSM